MRPAVLALLLLAAACSAPQDQAPGVGALTAGADEPAPAAAIAGGRAAPASPLTPEAAQRDVALLRQALEAIHPGYARYTPRAELDAGFEALAARAAPGLSDLELYGEVCRLLALIRCDHTMAEMPPDLARFRSQQATHLPFRFVIENGGMWVLSTDPQQERLPLGSEILELDGHPMPEILQTLSAAVPVDGFTDHVRPAKLASDAASYGSAFDRLYPVFFGFRDRYRLRLRRPDGGEEVRTMAPLSFARWQGLPWPAQTWRGDLVDAVRLQRPAPGTALLSVETFVNDRRPIDPDEIYRRIFRRLAADGTDSLILDLRGNGGGSEDAALALLGYLAARPFRYRRPSWVRAYRFGDLRAHLSTWNPRTLEAPEAWFRPLANGFFEVDPAAEAEAQALRQPQPESFGGRLYVLIGPGNRSGATMFLATLRAVRESLFVGEPTGGSSEGSTDGVPVFLRLPSSGMTVRIPLFRQYLDVESFATGRGVDPDVTVPARLEDLLAGRDLVLEEALRLAAAGRAPAAP